MGFRGTNRRVFPPASSVATLRVPLLRRLIDSDPGGGFQLPIADPDSRIILMSAEELKGSVAQLSAEELANFTRWLEKFVADQWDRQIEADVLAGRLDAAGQRADEHYKAGRCTPL